MRTIIKTTLLIILTLLIVLTSYDQFKVGVTGGLNISKFTVSDDNYEDYINNIRPGFIIGPTVIYNVPKTGLSFDISALFDMRGASSKSNINKESIYCNSLQLPFNVRYGVNYAEMVYWFVFTGPQIGFNIGSSESMIISGKSKNTGHVLERRWVNQSTSSSWNIGVGAIVLEKVQVRVSYNLALQKTAIIQQVDLDDGTSRVLTDGKAHACQIAISYLF